MTSVEIKPSEPVVVCLLRQLSLAHLFPIVSFSLCAPYPFSSFLGLGCSLLASFRSLALISLV